MKNNYLRALGLILLFVVTSCQKEDFDQAENSNESQVTYENSNIDNGRFVFKSSEDLKFTIHQFKEEESNVVSSKFEKFYESGFRSLKPIVDPGNEELIGKLSNEIERKKSANGNKETNTENNNIISDPYLAAFVNENNEIIVNDSVVLGKVTG